jgi:hypothetical protein
MQISEVQMDFLEILFGKQILEKRKEKNEGTVLGLIRPKALAQRPCAWLHRALAGRPNPRP